MLEAWETIDQNTSRKLVHTLAGPLFIVTWPLFSSASYAQYIAAVVPALNIARLLLVGYGWREDRRAVAAMSRTGDAKELLRGPLYYTLVLFAVVCIYWRTSPVAPQSFYCDSPSNVQLLLYVPCFRVQEFERTDHHLPHVRR